MSAQPNILFIMADQFRFDALGIVNGWTKTNCLDGLARDGYLFTNAITNSAECVPARFSLATGLYPHQTGVQRNGLYTLNPEFPTWMQAIEQAGYRTSLFGKTHLHPHEGDLRDRVHLMHAYGLQVVDETAGPRASLNVLSNMTEYWQDHGVLDSYRKDFAHRFASRPHVARPSPLGLEHYYDVYVARQACQYLKSFAHREPWYCWVSFGGPHEPWDAPEPYASLYLAADIPKATPRMQGADQVRGLLRHTFESPVLSPELNDDEVKALRANYAGNVTLIDDQIRNILNVVADRGELENTTVIFTSDHGEMNGDQGLVYKGTFLDPAIKIPVIIRPARQQRLGKQPSSAPMSSIAELMDLGATIVDYANGKLPELSRARSLRPLLEGETVEHRPFAVSEFLNHTAIIDDHWKVEFDSDNKAVVLFDRSEDPLEQLNLANDYRYSSVIAELQKRFQSFLAETPAPLVRVINAG